MEKFILGATKLHYILGEVCDYVSLPHSSLLHFDANTNMNFPFYFYNTFGIISKKVQQNRRNVVYVIVPSLSY